MYCVTFPPTYRGPRYLDMPFNGICFPLPIPPMIATLTVTKTLDTASGNIVPQDSRQARTLPESEKWLAAEDNEMESAI